MNDYFIDAQELAQPQHGNRQRVASCVSLFVTPEHVAQGLLSDVLSSQSDNGFEQQQGLARELARELKFFSVDLRFKTTKREYPDRPWPVVRRVFRWLQPKHADDILYQIRFNTFF